MLFTDVPTKSLPEQSLPCRSNPPRKAIATPCPTDAVAVRIAAVLLPLMAVSSNPPTLLIAMMMTGASLKEGLDKPIR